MFFTKYLANIATLLNWISWIAAMYFFFDNNIVLWFSFFVFSLFCDLIDGWLARKFWSTKNWAIYDDISDFISFGVLPGLAFFFIYWFNYLNIALAIIYIVSVLYRLIRFVKKDKFDKSLIKWNFNWLPSPAWAFILVSLISYNPNNSLFLIFFIIILSYLMISKINFLHFNNFLKTKLNKIFIILFVLFFIILIILLKFLGVFTLWLSYLLFWYILRKK